MDSARPSRTATPEEVGRLLRHSGSAVLLAPASRYPTLQLEPVARAYHLDEVNIDMQEAELPPSLVKSPRAFLPAARVSVMPPPSSSRAVRGVTHVKPGRVIAGSMAYLSSWLTITATLIGLPLWMFVSNDERASLWMLAPLGLLVATLLWASYAVPRARCTVCRQPMFTNLKCLKNERAHRFAFGNTALSSALVALLSFRLRCPYCGTRQHLHGRQH